MENKKSTYEIFEVVLYIIMGMVLLGVIITNRVLNGFGDILWLSDMVSILSFAYVIFAARHSWFGLLFNFLATCVLIAVDLIQHVWLNAAICIFISVPFLIFGMIRWSKNKKSGNDDKNLNKLSTKMQIIVWILYAVLCVPFAFLLKALNGNLYVFDAIYSLGCVVGLILFSFAYIDQFFVFIVANIFGLVMYILLTIQNTNNLSLIIIVFIYIIGNIIGFINWRKLLKKDKDIQETEEE